jgi:hypothetical protein
MILRRLLPGVVLVLVTACGSDGGKSQSGCSAPEITGTIFGGTGTATVTGTGTLPDGIADGLEVNILVSSGNVSVGVLPDNLLSTNDRVCGKTVRYTAKGLSAGTYRLTFDVVDPNSDSFKSLYEGEAESDFTIADGQTLMVDAKFHLTS